MNKSGTLLSISLLLSILLLGFVETAQAQYYDNVVKTRPFAPINRSFTLAYEKAVSQQVSLQVEGMYKFPRRFTNDASFDGKLRITPEVKFFLSESKAAPEGFYLAPFLRYSVQGASVEREELDVHFFGGGGSLGYQFITSGGFAVEMFTGFGYGRATGELEDDDYIYTGGVGLPIMRLGFAMGVAW